MCIDSQMLSAYLDGELPEPYRTQVEEHLEHCAACRKHLDDMRALERRIQSSEFPEEQLMRNKDRIFSLLDKKYFQNGNKVSFIRRRLEISLPSLITAAAAVVFIFIGGFMFFGTSSEQTEDILRYRPDRCSWPGTSVPYILLRSASHTQESRGN